VPASDRYADAVRARRAELRAQRALLLGGHRAEVRGRVAALRVVASAELSAALADLGRELCRHADRADRSGRARLPRLAGSAVDALAARAVERWTAAVLPVLHRVATERGVPWPGAGAVAAIVGARPPPVPLPAPEPPPGTVRALLLGAAGGTWRVALLPAAALPTVGLPALGGPAALPSALVLAATGVVLAARAQRCAAERAALRCWAGDVVSAARAALEAELARRLLELDHVAGAALDEAVACRRREIDAELRDIAAEPEGAGG
jgi:hypothetical protein